MPIQFRPVRVAIIDDVTGVRAMLRAQLERDGRFEVAGEARDGDEASRLVQLVRPDAVVVDVRMPSVDGLEAVTAIREVAPDVKIVAVSAFPDPFTLGTLLLLGADAYLDKAAAWSELVPTLTNLFALDEDVSFEPV